MLRVQKTLHFSWRRSHKRPVNHSSLTPKMCTPRLIMEDLASYIHIVLKYKHLGGVASSKSRKTLSSPSPVGHTKTAAYKQLSMEWPEYSRKDFPQPKMWRSHSDFGSFAAHGLSSLGCPGLVGCSLWDLNSLTRIKPHVPCIAGGCLATGLQGKSPQWHQWWE